MNSVRALLERARGRLAATSEEAALDSQVLLAHALGRDRSWLFAWPEHVPEAAQVAHFERLVADRERGLPVAHLVGEREFWSLRLEVSRDTLIPRPETEQLVEIALGLDLPAAARVVELGTGSGAIALALASERPHWHILATERSSAALEVARRNAAALGLARIEFRCSDWYSDLPDGLPADLILSNPPYIADDDPHLARGDLRFEPRAALRAGADGLDDIRRIVRGAAAHLQPEGWLWLEHGHDQGEAVAGLLGKHGYREITLRRDHAGHARHSGGRAPRPVAPAG